MILFSYPIVHELRLPLLVLDWIIFIIALELGIIFIIRYERQKASVKSYEEIGYACLFIGFSMMILFSLIADFYSSNELITPFLIWENGTYRDLYVGVGYLTLMFGILLFTFFVEINKKYLFFRFFFSLCFLITTIISLSHLIIGLDNTWNFAILFWGIFLFFLFIYIKEFISRTYTKDRLWIGFLRYYIPFILVPIGFLFKMDFTVNAFGIWMRILGSIFQLISLFIFLYLFLKLPSLSEFDWRESIDELYLMNKDGVCVYHKFFGENLETLDEHLITGAITSVKIVLKELMNTQEIGLSIIEKEGKLISIYSSDFLTGVMIGKENLASITSYLKEMVIKLESIYKNVLENWDGDLGIFSPIEDIISEILKK